MKIIFSITLLLIGAVSGYSQTFIQLNEQFIVLFKKGEYKAALPIGLKALQQAQKEYGENNINYAIAADNVATTYTSLEQPLAALPYYKKAEKSYTASAKSPDNEGSATCNNTIATIYFAQKKYDSSAIFFERALAYFINHPAEQYNNVIVVMNSLTDLYLATNKYANAKVLYEKVLTVIEAKEGKVNENYCTTVSNLGSALYNLQEFALGETVLKNALPNVEKLNGANSVQYSAYLDMIANCVREQDRFKEAETILLQSLKIKESLPTPDTSSLASSYSGLALLYGDIGEFGKSYSYFNQALTLLKTIGLQESDDFITIVKSFGYTCITGGQLSDAKKLLQRVLELQTKKYGADFAGNGEVLVSMGNAELQSSELTAAEAHTNEGLAVIIKNLGEDNYAVARAKEILGLLYHKLGNSSKGIEMFRQAIAVDKKVFGEESKYSASVLSNMGLVYQDIGDFADAEIVLRQSLEIRKKVYGVEHPEYALSLCNLAMVYVYQAGYVQADKMLVDALNIYIKKDLLNTNNFISIINNIAFMAERQQNYAESKKLYVRLLEMLEARDVKNPGALYLILNNLSASSLNEDNYKDAITYALKAMEYAKANQGMRSLEYIKSANNCLVAYRKSGDLLKARQMTNELIPLCKEVMGKDAEVLGIICFNAAMVENSEGNYDKAASYLDQALTIYLNGFRKNFYTLSEKEKLSWWQDQSFHFAMYPSLLKQSSSNNATMVAAMTNQQLQLKGFVLNDASSALRKARSSGNKALQKLIDDWQLNRTILAKQLSLPLAERLYSTDSVEAIANNLEKAINQQAAGLIKIQQDNNVNWQAVQSSLKQDEAAIEFMRFPFYRGSDYTDTMQYAAIVIRKDQVAPKFVLLGNEAQINWCLTGGKTDSKEIRINSLYRSSLGKSTSVATFAGDSLYNIIWKPLMPYLQNIHTVSYAPDGLLHKVAFHALPVNDKTLLIDLFQLQSFTSIKQLTESVTGSDKFASVYMMGNADFNSTAATTASSNFKVSFTSTHTGNTSWAALPGTEKEVDALQPLFATKNVKVTVERGSNATEEMFKSLSGNAPSIIHLATHGFFLPDPVNKKDHEVSANENAYTLSDDPLMRSGVVMAGANKAWNGEKIADGVEDGILTAYEIAQLDLSKTKLVVLSACETALGDLQGSEGVFGLQRSFKIAGVKNLVVSLWQVPDKETAELMGIFYNHLLSGVPVRDAFYQAQKEMRSKYAPYLWAAFVLIE